MNGDTYNEKLSSTRTEALFVRFSHRTLLVSFRVTLAKPWWKRLGYHFSMSLRFIFVLLVQL